MRRILSLSLILVLMVAFAAVPAGAQDDMEAIDCYGAEGSELSVMASWAGEEETKFRTILQPVLDACDIELSYEGTRDMNTVLPTRVEGGQAPDLVVFPNPGQIPFFADELVSLRELAVNPENYNESWIEIGSYGGEWYGLPVKTDIKSLVWYSPISFELAGYEVPASWEDFMALLETISMESDTPALATGFESAGATGWTATDFVQDILVRQQGPEFAMGLTTGETAWTDPGVAEAWTTYIDLVNDYGMGAEASVTTSFADAILQPFQDPPQAWMVKQSGFAGSAVIAPEFSSYLYGPGEDYAFFVLPGAGGDPAAMQIAGDILVAFNDSPAVMAVVDYLSSEAGANAWAAAAFDLTPNAAVDLASYTDAISADKAAALAAAPGVIFDTGDLLPGGVGQVEFDMITAAVQGSTSVEDALANLQAAFDDAGAGMEGDVEEGEGGEGGEAESGDS